MGQSFRTLDAIIQDWANDMVAKKSCRENDSEKILKQSQSAVERD